jgi:hypothetical protein
MSDPLAPWRGSDGKLPAFTSFGCYPLLYLDRHDNVLCPECANGYEPGDDDAPVDVGENWEDPALHCDECSARIESAYAEDEAETPDGP